MYASLSQLVELLLASCKRSQQFSWTTVDSQGKRKIFISASHLHWQLVSLQMDHVDDLHQRLSFPRLLCNLTTDFDESRLLFS
jgi:hypothetical protein